MPRSSLERARRCGPGGARVLPAARPEGHPWPHYLPRPPALGPSCGQSRASRLWRTSARRGLGEPDHLSWHEPEEAPGFTGRCARARILLCAASTVWRCGMNSSVLARTCERNLDTARAHGHRPKPATDPGLNPRGGSPQSLLGTCPSRQILSHFYISFDQFKGRLDDSCLS